MKKKPLVSVIMPCYNAVKFIGEAIESILLQSLPDLELIIIDDGSTDSTAEVVERINEERIRYVRFDKNKGNYFARNRGLDLATGRYVAMADADDIAYMDRLKIQFEHMEAHPEVMVLGGQCDVVDEEGSYIGELRRPLAYDEIRVALLQNNFVHQPTLMFRRELVEKGYCYDESFPCSGDYDFVYRISRFFRIVNLDKVIVKYRRHPRQLSTAKRDLQHQYADRVRECQLVDFGMVFSGRELEIHQKLAKGNYLDNKELWTAERWINSLLEHNMDNDIYDRKCFYEFCQRLSAAAVRKNHLGK
ncbi:hypothetical protein DN752_16870 [Echinicola strongylocentroti]|uniref:Glycosyltransferase 2-like domain-containing protein n=1 Tax=Echinicola strongylocentroti TaxID=1795355 RepID=A0A2Z4ILA0_9BACT|nr:glycosyltransferase [Echinicola strongylocentroti]AWW31664.1 hypothetical protein DN752_16870 [Echinicola strongylocentroti]